MSHKLADAVSIVSVKDPGAVLATLQLGELARPNHLEFVDNARGQVTYMSLARMDDGGPNGAVSSRLAIHARQRVNSVQLWTPAHRRARLSCRKLDGTGRANVTACRLYVTITRFNMNYAKWFQAPGNNLSSSRRHGPKRHTWARVGVLGAVTLVAAGCGGSDSNDSTTGELVTRGQAIFRFDTFGDETQWTDTLRLHEVIRSSVSPVVALAVGLKVDSAALPAVIVQGIKDGSINLTLPATTVALLKLNAVVGLQGTVETINGVDTLTRVGVTCALCHSTVDDSFAKGIGKRLDGWPNRDLNPGAIIALSPALDISKKAVYLSWGKGKYDPRFNLDGINGPQVIPPAFGLQGINKITSTGDGDDLAYWNRYVGVTQMGGHGSFYEPRTGVKVSNGTDDLITAKLPALQAYQLSIAAPPPPAGSFDATAAARGKVVFNTAGQCATCHTGDKFTDANTRMHPPTDVASEPEPNGAPSYASRSATKQYRTAPLAGLWQHPPYFHNGSAPTLEAVVQTYNTKRALGLTTAQAADLVQYLKSL